MKFCLLLCMLLLPIIQHAQTRSGKDFAVFFYVKDFPTGWDALPLTKTECEQIKLQLETNFGFTCELVPNPTRQQMKNKIRQYNTLLGPQDQALFFFSTHGYYNPVSDRGYLIGSDGPPDDAYGDLYYSYDDLRNDLSACQAKHILIALDACHSGSFNMVTRGQGQPATPVYREGKTCSEKVAKTLQYTGRQFCTSGNKRAKTPGKSAFAADFLETLIKGGADGLIFFDDLAYRLGKLDNPRPETGTFGNHQPGGDFVFTRTGNCASLPDGDGDSVPDAVDQCPNDWGSQLNGCPASTAENNVKPDLEAWKKAKAENNKNSYLSYLKSFPNGAFKPECNDALRKIEADEKNSLDETAWLLAQEKNTPDAYRHYLTNISNGRHAREAQQRIAAAELSDIDLVRIKGGSFHMGCDDNMAKDCDRDELPEHLVYLHDFFINKYEVTQRFWQKIMGNNPSANVCETCPVENVSWTDVEGFIKKLNTTSGENYRLPTEAEWEYAAKTTGSGLAQLAGIPRDEADLARFAWFSAVSQGKSHPVGEKLPNGRGIYDMSGNVHEWCSDLYGRYSKTTQTNPIGSNLSSEHVCRGGSWADDFVACRITNRSSALTTEKFKYIGFRIAKSASN